MTEKKSVLVIAQEQTNALEVFKNGGVEKLVADLEEEVRSILLDPETKKGRKEIASLAHKVSRSKTALDGLGKELVAEWKAKSKAVDSDRKQIRDRLDNLRDEVRKPLTDWEEAEKAKAEKEKLEAEKLEAYEAAIVENDLFDRQRLIALKEEEQRQAELKRIEDERKAKEERDRLDREDRLRKEAAAAAKEKAERKAEQEKIEAETRLKKEREAKEEAERKAEHEKVLAEERRIRDLEEQEERIKEEQEAKERARLKKKAEEREEAEIKAANKNHQRSVNNGILKHLKSIGISETHAKLLITKVAKNEVPNIKIIY